MGSIRETQTSETETDDLQLFYPGAPASSLHGLETQCPSRFGPSTASREGAEKAEEMLCPREAGVIKQKA